MGREYKCNKNYLNISFQFPFLFFMFKNMGVPENSYNSNKSSIDIGMQFLNSLIFSNYTFFVTVDAILLTGQQF